MGTFTGGNADEIITPAEVSPTVIAVDGSRPSGGDDTISSGGGSDTVAGGGGGDFIDGGPGADLLEGRSGDDTINWDPGDGSDTADGGSGLDTMAFNLSNAAEKINLFAVSGHAILTRDVGTITMDLDSIERVAFGPANGGVDSFVIGDLSSTNVRGVDIDLGSSTGVPDGLVDTVEVHGLASRDRIEVSTANGVTTVAGLSAVVNVSRAEAVDRLIVDGGDEEDVLAIGGLGKGDDTVLLTGTLAPAGDTGGDPMQFEVNADASSISLRNVETVTVDSGAGDDAINARTLQSSAHLHVDGGSGADTIGGGGGADTLDGGSGDDVIDGNIGADVMLGGDGDDTLIWDPGDGSDVHDGGSDLDTTQFNVSNAAELITLIESGGHAILTRDVGTIVMDLDNVERVTLQGGGGGADTFFLGDLSATDVRQIEVDLGAIPDALVDSISAMGGSGRDRVKIAGAGGSATVDGLAAKVSVTHAEAGDRLVVNALDGPDVIDASAFQGGLSLTLWGSNGSDRFLFGASAGASVEILDFQTHSLGADGDRIVLNAFPDTTFALAVVNHHIVQAGADVVVSDVGGAIVTLRNTSLADLTADDFLFG